MRIYQRASAALMIMIAGTVLMSACERHATSPTSAAATIQGLTISGLPTEFSVGERAQLTAWASWSDGRAEDVTIRARWTSRSLACLVSPAGSVTGNLPGDCFIDASFEMKTAATNVVVGQARTFTVSGVAREQYELREPPIAGATVIIVSGPQTGRNMTTDNLGRFAFVGVPRDRVTLRVEAPLFEAVAVEATPEKADVDAFLPPEMVTLTWDSRAGGIAPPDTDRFEIPFETHHRGYITLKVYSSSYECGTYETFTGSVSEDVTPWYLSAWYLTISPCRSYLTGLPEMLSDARPPGRYKVSMSRLSGRSRPRTNIVSVTHPR